MTLTKKVIKAPQSIGKRVIEALIPSYNWCLYWKETLLQTMKETPVLRSDKIMADLNRCIYGGSIPEQAIQSRFKLPQELKTVKISTNLLQPY